MLPHMTVTIPEYFTVKQFKAYNRVKHFDGLKLYTNVIASVLDIELAVVMQWPLSDIKQIYTDIINMINETESKFHPVIIWNGIEYGYSHMPKMKVGAYIDLENNLKDPTKNIDKILKVMYRPVVKNKLKSTKYVIKSVIKAYNDKVEEPFEYYDLAEYDNKSDIDYSSFPISIALGGMSFFLQHLNKLGIDSIIYLDPTNPIVKEMKMRVKNKPKTRFKAIMGGLLPSILSPIPTYSVLQETKQ